MQRLAIRLGSQPQSPIHWLVYSDGENEILASGTLNGEQELVKLSEHADQSEVIAFVPASDVYFTKVTLPQKGARKVINAIPFMIEEELASSIDELFFALGAHVNGQQEVAVVAKTQMQHWYNTLNDAGIFCPTLIPDAYCLSGSAGMTLLELDDELLVKTPEGRCLQGESSWLLPLILEQIKDTDAALTCFSEVQNWPDTLEATFDFDDLPLQRLLTGSQAVTLNLFQNEYTQKRKSNLTWDKWKLAASLAVVAICANLIYKTVELNALKSEHAALVQQTKSQVQKGFPNLRSVRLVRPAVEREMARLEQGGGSLSMLAMLARLGNAFEVSGVKPQNIRFDNKRSELRMQSVANSFESLDKFKQDVQTLGFEVEQGAINNRGNEVVGVIVVKG